MKQHMKTFTFVLLCSLASVACARPLKTLSDGQPGYVVTCDTLRERCIDEISLMCRGKGYVIVAERADEIRLDILWTTRTIPPGWVHASYNSRYWMEVRCEGVD